MATIKFFIQTKANPAGIYVRLREGVGIDAKAKTKFVIKQSDWSASKGMPKMKDAELKALSNDLQNFHNKLLHHYNKCASQQTIDSQWLKEFISPPEKIDEIPNKIVPYIDYFNTVIKNQIGSSTYKRNNTYKNLIIKFEKSSKRNYFIRDFNEDFKIKFEKFGELNTYAPNTIARTIKFIKTICRHARGNGIDCSFQLDSIKVKLTTGQKIFLNPKELDKIEKKVFELDSLDNARDWLLISCETAQRVSDFMRFEKEFVRIERGNSLVEFSQIKTKAIMSVPLSSRVKRILKKRKGKFPRKISSQKYNEYIKEVCRLSGIDNMVAGSLYNPTTERKEKGIYPKWKLVTSHIGRISFASNNFGNINTGLLMSATGHTTEKQFLNYIGKTDTEKAHQLAKYLK